MMLKFDDIQTDPEVFTGPRVDLGNVEQLARQLMMDGLESPLLVWRQDDQCYLADGWRRYAALEWIQREHPDIFAMRFARVDVEEARGDEFEVLLQVVRRNLQERSYNLADLANGVHMLFSAYWLDILASELRIEERLLEAALRLKLSVPDGAFAEFARTSTSIEDVPGLLGQNANVAVEQIRSFIKEHHAKRRDRHGASRERGADRQATRKHTRPKIAELREERGRAAEELRTFRKEYEARRRPTTLTGLPEDGTNAGYIVFYRGEEARLTARIEALDWALGERSRLQ